MTTFLLFNYVSRTYPNFGNKINKIPYRKPTDTSLLHITPRKTNAHGEKYADVETVTAQTR